MDEHSSRVTRNKDKWSVMLEEAELGRTLADVVRALSPDPLSWKQARQLIRSGKVFLGGARVLEPSQRLAKVEELDIFMSAPKPAKEGELALDRLIYVDEHIVVVNKPADLLTVAYREDDPVSLEVLVRGSLQKIRKGKANEPLFVIHRLDRLTSGVMVFARTQKAFDKLKVQFQEHTIDREYRAIVWGMPRDGRLSAWITENRGDQYRGVVPERDARRYKAKRASLHVSVENAYTNVSLVRCVLDTGRTHQVRIQLSDINHPVIGDKVYLKALARRGRTFPNIPFFHRQALHAYRLGFTHPATGEPVRYTAPLPQDMRRFLKGCEPLPPDQQPKKRHGAQVGSSAKRGAPQTKHGAVEPSVGAKVGREKRKPKGRPAPKASRSAPRTARPTGKGAGSDSKTKSSAQKEQSFDPLSARPAHEAMKKPHKASKKPGRATKRDRSSSKSKAKGQGAGQKKSS